MPMSGRGLGGYSQVFLPVAPNSLERHQLPPPSPDLTALIIDFKRSG